MAHGDAHDARRGWRGNRFRRAGGHVGRLAAGGIAVGAGWGTDCGVGCARGWVVGGGAAAAWFADVSFCSRSAKRCMVRCSKAERSLFSRFCSSRSDSYWASFRPAVPTHWSTGLTWPPGGMTPMLVTPLGTAAVFPGSLRCTGLAVRAKISHKRPTPPARMAPSRAYCRCLGDSRSTRPRVAAKGLLRGAPGRFMAGPPCGSRRPACARQDAGCDARWRCRRRRPLRRLPGRIRVRPAPCPCR